MNLNRVKHPIMLNQALDPLHYPGTQKMLKRSPKEDTEVKKHWEWNSNLKTSNQIIDYYLKLKGI